LKTSPRGVAVHYNDDVLGVAAAAAAAAAVAMSGAEQCIVCCTTTTVHRHATLIHGHVVVTPVQASHQQQLHAACNMSSAVNSLLEQFDRLRPLAIHSHSHNTHESIAKSQLKRSY